MVAGAGPRQRVKVVVMVDSIRQPGGAETLAIEGAIRLDPERFERHFCITRWSDDLEDREPSRTWLARLRDADVRVLGLRRRHRLALWAWLPLLRLLRRERIDVLHGHLFGSNVWASLLGRLARVPVVIAHEHMWAYSGNRFRPLLDRELIARLTSAFIAVSEEGRRRMITVERIPAEDVVYLPNGVPATPAGDGERIRAELGVAPDAPVVGSVGHLRREKAYEVLIEAAGRLRESQPGLQVLIAGEGPERPALEALRAQLGLDDVVRLLGARDDVPDLLAAFDVAACSSDFEGGPLSVMEYMGAALPVVATRVGGLPELVHDGETGILVPPRDPGALADALARLLADPSLRTRLGSAGRELRASEYDIDVWVGRLEDLYLRCLSERNSGRG